MLWTYLQSIGNMAQMQSLQGRCTSSDTDDETVNKCE
jgi:hypothetical protein